MMEEKMKLILFLLGSSISLTMSVVQPPTLELGIKERQTDYLLINWTVNDPNNTIDSYQVKVKDVAKRYYITYEGEHFVKSKIREAKVMVHVPDHLYEVCLVAILTKNASENLTAEIPVERCIEASTIENIQISSVVALIAVILFFVLCVLIGYISWKCAKSKQNSENRENSDVNENGDIVPLTQIED